MGYARQMLDTYPRALDADADMPAAAIDGTTDCAQARIADTDADLGEQNVTEMTRCIRLCLNCADVCTATAGVTSRPASHDAAVTEPLLEACAAICKGCGDECEQHAPDAQALPGPRRGAALDPVKLVSGSGSRRLRCW